MRRLLMIAYEFPPLAAGGVARTLAFARYLPSHGWEPHVLTVSNHPPGPRDDTTAQSLPVGVRVHRARSFEHHGPRDGLANIARMLGGDQRRWQAGLDWRLKNIWDRLAIPDAKIYWALPAVAKGIALVLRHHIDAVYSTSWPWSDHVAGALISACTGRPLIVDFRDPWSQHMNQRHNGGSTFTRHARMERWVCRKAAAVITPVRAATQALRQVMPDLPRNRFQTIRNGFDPADFREPVDTLPGFEVVYAGTFYRTRRADAFLEALRLFLKRTPDARAHTRVRMFGTSTDHDLSRLKRDPVVEVHGWTSREQVMRALRESAVLLSVRHFEPGCELTIPGKIYEYLATGNHILAVHPPQTELDRILRASHNATIVHHNRPQPIAEALVCLYARWAAGELPQRQAPAFVDRLGRDHQTAQLAYLIDSVVTDGRVHSNRRRSRATHQALHRANTHSVYPTSVHSPG